jgi:hypothetical protein
LGNFRKHGKRGQRGIDPYSSAIFFDAFVELAGRRPIEVNAAFALESASGRSPPQVVARTWLLRTGWQRHGLISIHESPKQASATSGR